MKLYIDRTEIQSYEVDATEQDVWAALKVQDIEPDFPGETLNEVLSRVEGTLPCELALAALVGDTSEEDHSETWSLNDWDDADDNEE